MADAALTEANVPHFLRQELSSGLRIAMPAAPSMAPGTWFAILVPEEHADEARAILSELPFEVTTTPDVWDGQEPAPSLAVRRCVAIFAFIALAWVAYQMVLAVVRPH